MKRDARNVETYPSSEQVDVSEGIKNNGKASSYAASSSFGGRRKYRKWLILAVFMIGTGVGGYLYVQSFKPDDAGMAAESSYSGGVMGPVQILMFLSVPLLIIGIAPSAATCAHIYKGEYSDDSRVFWMVTVWILMTAGVIAYWIFGNRRRSPRRSSGK